MKASLYDLMGGAQVGGAVRKRLASVPPCRHSHGWPRAVQPTNPFLPRQVSARSLLLAQGLPGQDGGPEGSRCNMLPLHSSPLSSPTMLWREPIARQAARCSAGAHSQASRLQSRPCLVSLRNAVNPGLVRLCSPLPRTPGLGRLPLCYYGSPARAPGASAGACLASPLHRAAA